MVTTTMNDVIIPRNNASYCGRDIIRIDIYRCVQSRALFATLNHLTFYDIPPNRSGFGVRD